jgi:NAD(P)-dependent dehydrogenase (short-subunit alcohol dehydrogenase family)
MARTAIVTGASSGIGEATAAMLADLGFNVCVTARRGELLQDICDKINDKYGPETAIFCAGDVTDAEVRQTTFDQVMSAWGRVDVLVNNAGGAWSGAVEEIELDLLRKQFELTTIAYVAWMQLVGPVMRRQGSGRMINVSSITGRLPLPGTASYSASKAAIETICDVARLEYRPWDIQIVLVAPGAVTTEIWHEARKYLEAEHKDWRSSDFSFVYQGLLAYVENVIKGGKGVIEVEALARVICRAATAKRPKAKYFTPLPVWLMSHLMSSPAGFRDWIVRQAVKG